MLSLSIDRNHLHTACLALLLPVASLQAQDVSSSTLGGFFTDPAATFQEAGNWMADTARSAWHTGRSELDLLPETLTHMPGAVSDTLMNGEALDSFRGFFDPDFGASTPDHFQPLFDLQDEGPSPAAPFRGTSFEAPPVLDRATFDGLDPRGFEAFPPSRAPGGEAGVPWADTVSPDYPTEFAPGGRSPFAGVGEPRQTRF